MRIRSFHIDAFGLLRDLTVDSLPSGTAIFLGRNEAGKSTLLDFLRSVLTGYPRTRGLRDRAYITGQALFGGSLELDTPQGIIRLTRRPGRDGGLPVLTDCAGAPLDAALWDRMLGGVGREVYASVYGFSLSELQNLQTLSSEGVRNALYGASFGMGLHSPGAALKKLDALLDGLFKARGSSQKISRALNEWEELRRRIREGEGEIARYDALSDEREALEERLGILRGERKTLERERRELERRLRVWRQWEEWRLAGIRLDRLESVPATIPLDGPVRLERALERRANAERETERVREREERTREALAACLVDERLLEFAETLRGLNGGTSSCRNALAVLPGLRTALRRSEAERDRELAALGTGWTLERVRRTGRPLAFREELERQAEEMRSAGSALENARNACERAEEELEAARTEYESARGRLAGLPMPKAVPDGSEREILRVRIVRAEATWRERPELERAHAEAEEGFRRELRRLGVADERGLNGLAGAQEEIVRRSAHLRDAEEALLHARRVEEQVKGEERRQTARVEELTRKRQILGACDASALEVKRSALRELRAVLGNLAAEESSLAEAEDRLAAHLAETPGLERSPLLMTLGILFAATGVGIGAFYLLKLEIPGDIPRTPWLTALFVLAGISFIWAGLPRRRPEAARHAAEAERLHSRREQRLARRDALREQAERLDSVLFPDASASEAETAGAARRSAGELDTLEAVLEQERDCCRTAGRLEQEAHEAREELRSLRENVRAAQEACAELTARLESLDRDWKSFFTALGVSQPPRAGEVDTFCARIDAALLALRGVQERRRVLEAEEKQLEELAGQIDQLRSLMTDGEGNGDAVLSSLFVDTEGRSALPEVETLSEAGRELLKDCAEADRIVAERTRLTEELGAAGTRRRQLEQTVQEARRQLDEAGVRAGKVGATWRSLLMRIGLTEGETADFLPPETARQVLESMDRVQRLEADCDRLGADILRQEKERDAVLLPLRDVLAALGRLPRDEEETGVAADEEAVLALLDELIRDVEQARLEAEERRRLQTRLAELEEERHRAQAVAEDAELAFRRLLHTAEAVDPEDFLHRHAVRQEREAVLQRREELEDMLRLAALDAARDETGRSPDAAGGETVPEDDAKGMRDAGTVAGGTLSEAAFRSFLDGFTRLEKEEMESRQAEVSGRLVWLEEECARLDDESRTIKVRMENQVSSDTLQRDRMDASRVAENIRELAREWARYALARRLLVEARGRFERERQPKVIRIASRLFSGITDGKWIGISASLEDSSLRVLPPHGEPVSPELLSRGTQEQLYLALRLAHIRSHAVSLPVIMDDVLVNFDPERAVRTAMALGDLNRDDESGPGHQLLFFTCHPQTARLLRDTIPDSRLFLLDRGAVTGAE